MKRRRYRFEEQANAWDVFEKWAFGFVIFSIGLFSGYLWAAVAYGHFP